MLEKIAVLLGEFYVGHGWSDRLKYDLININQS